MKKLVHVEERFTADSMVALLKDNGIESYSQAPGIGGLMHIGSGKSMNGYDIFVDEKKYDEANDLVSCLALFEEYDKPASGNDWQELEAVRRKRQLYQRSIAVILIVMLVLAIVEWYLH